MKTGKQSEASKVAHAKSVLLHDELSSLNDAHHIVTGPILTEKGHKGAVHRSRQGGNPGEICELVEKQASQSTRDL